MEKTNKSFTKRLKVTKKKKIIQRSPGMGHFNAKERRKKQLIRKRGKEFGLTVKEQGHFMPFS